MNLLRVLLLATALALGFAGGASAQAIGGSASLSVTTSSSSVQLPASLTSYPSVIIAPAVGSTQEVFYALGGSTVAATTSSPALPGGGICVNVGPRGYVAAITASSTATVRVTQLTTCALFARGGSVGSGGSGTVTSVSVVTANGISGSVANPTTTPAITVTLGDITPSSVTIGAGSSITSSGPGGTLGSNAFNSTSYLPLAGGTLTGALLFTDNTLDIGAAGATRPRTGYFGTGISVGGCTIGSSTLCTSGLATVGGNLALPATSSTVGNILSGASTVANFFGTQNIFLGGAGNYTLTVGNAINNFGAGISSLAGLTTGSQDVGLGAFTLTSCTSCTNAMAIGFGALNSMTTGGTSVAIGANAANKATTSTALVAIGNGVAPNVITASGTLIGNNAATDLTTGATNISIGSSSGNTITTGTLNTVIGSSSSSPATVATFTAATLNSTTTAVLAGNDTSLSLLVGMLVAGTGIPAGTTITVINGDHVTLTLSQAATSSVAAILTFTASPNSAFTSSTGATTNLSGTTVTFGGTGSDTVSGQGVLNGTVISGVGVPANAKITACASNTSCTANMALTTETAEVVTFTNPPGGLGILTGSNNTIIGGNLTGLLPGLNSSIILADGNNNIRGDYNKTTANRWNLFGASSSTGGVTINSTLTSTSKTTGSLINNGGFGNAGTMFTDTLNVISMAATLNANVVCYNSGTGLLTSQVSATGCAASAIRFKNLWSPRSLNLAGLDELRTDIPWSYRSDSGLDEGGKRHVGLFADDVEKMDPRCVSYEDGRVTNYEERCLIAYLVADRQNLRSRVEALERLR